MNAGTESALAGERAVCFHCGDDVPPEAANLTARIDGVSRPMCCPGCRAVAQLIAGSGLQGFYRRRTAYNTRPPRARAEQGADYHIYDDPEVMDTFTTRASDGTLSAAILVGGITCAACAWLIERSLQSSAGVVSAAVNQQQSRLDVRVDPRQMPLSELFAQLAAIGYQPRPFRQSARREQAREQQRDTLRRVSVAGLGMMQVGMFAIALHAGELQGMETEYRALLRWVSLPVAAFVVGYSARPFFRTAWRHLRAGALVMDLPVALAIGLAFLASAWATISGSGQVYFDSVVMFTFFLLLGRYLEERARQRQVSPWLDVLDSLPEAVLTRSGGRWVSTPSRGLDSGDELLLRPGDTVPVDAVVTSGSGEVREDPFSGEHLPRKVQPGDPVFAGTVNLDGRLELRALGDRRHSRLAALQRSAEAGGAAKPRVAQLADRVASWFIAGVLSIAAVTALAWWAQAPDRALWVTLSVLVVSCPCALALATPAALTSAAAALRNRGVAVHGENALDALARCDRLLLDKTGTLTRGELSIAAVNLLGALDRESVLRIAAAMQRHNDHPVAAAFGDYPPTDGIELAEYRAGAGLEARAGDARYRLGSADFCRELAPALENSPATGLYWIALCRDATPLAWIGLADSPRPEAGAFLARARAAGLTPELLSGDSSPQGPLLAADLGIREVRTGQSPADKMRRVRELQASGHVVAMVGDGLNDGPVLSVADASFAVSGATDLARARADFVVLDGGLHQIMDSWLMARRCRAAIAQNLAWALLYNACALPLAVMGLVPPWAAAAGMSASSLLVVGNSLRLNRAQPAGGAAGRG